MKLSTNHGGNMGELHAKFHQNWWSGFRDIERHDTEEHSFIIIRIGVNVVLLYMRRASFIQIHYSTIRIYA